MENSRKTETMVRQDRRLYIEVLRGMMLGNINTNDYEEIRDGELDDVDD